LGGGSLCCLPDRLYQRWIVIARYGLMTWCENNGVDFLFGLARNARHRLIDRKTVYYQGSKILRLILIFESTAEAFRG
jgi:hypothetical protein